MIVEKIKNQVIEVIDTQIKILEARKEEDKISCACCIIGEIDDDLGELQKLKEHINNFND